ncbi:MAG: DUF3187 family protein [Deltaproteobacteria bacterium]|nr:DUF3187 family protein [Deltaproteobacteria bacterium]
MGVSKMIMNINYSKGCLLILLIIFLFIHTGRDAFCDNLIRYQDMGSGPVSVINQTPMQLLFLQPAPDRAETLPQGAWILRLNNVTTNTLLSESSGLYSGHVDMEMIRNAISVQYGLHPRFELNITLPFMYSYSGYMDHTIKHVESFFGNTRKVREKQDIDRYEYHIEKNGKTFIGGNKRCSGVGDLSFGIKGKIWKETDYLPCLSTRLLFKAPTGDEDRSLGSGKPDLSLGILLQKEINSFKAYLNADVIFPGDAFDSEDVSVNRFYIALLALEYRLDSKWSCIVQGRYTSRPFEHTGLKMLETRIFDVLIGVNYQVKGGYFIQAGGVEDCWTSDDASADVTFFLNLGKVFF